jgi:anhydro-N-acetylmuramic acid kinase
MEKIYTSLGLMSGTSMDGVDASIIQTDGKSQYKAILDKYFEYPVNIYNNLTSIRAKIKNSKDVKKYQKKINCLEKELTIFHAESVHKILKKTKLNLDFIGFHGQTIFHNAKEKISIQLGDGKLLSKLTKKNVVYNFRENDLINGGEGAPLAPVFHKLLVEQNKIKTPVTILNIGGIANITSISNKSIANRFALSGSEDIGPGNCLIDRWIRLKSDNKYDEKGLIARSGIVDKFILNQSLDNFYNSNISKKKSHDTNDFDLSFARNLNLENGAATLTEFTADICSKKLVNRNIYVSGGGRKNTFLIDSIKKKISCKIKLIDNVGVDGDFLESQAFAYLAIRSYLGLSISFPHTTGCKKPCTGGVVVKNF